MPHIFNNDNLGLAQEDIYRACGIPSPELEREVAEVVVATLNKLQPLRPDLRLKLPVIRYDLKGRVAGRASSSYIRLNTELLYNNKEVFLNQTIPHETCHVVQRQWYPHSQSHGYEWSKLMLHLGLVPERCHSYETTPARKIPRPHVYYCPICSKEFYLTNILHNRIRRGQVRICKKCRSHITYSHSTND